MAEGYINTQSIVTFASEKMTTHDANTWTKVDYSITIPANSIFSIELWTFYTNSAPAGVCIADQSVATGAPPKYSRWLYSTDYSKGTISGFTEVDHTYYFYVMYDGNNTDRVKIRGWYKKMS